MLTVIEFGLEANVMRIKLEITLHDPANICRSLRVNFCRKNFKFG